jgi:hypothetical protein
LSWVTNVIVSVAMPDRDNAEVFAALVRDMPYLHLDRKAWPNIPDPWPEDQEYDGPRTADLRKSPDSVWPGSKAPECYVWLGVLNNSDLHRFRVLFASIPWQLPNAVQLMLMDQEESFFRLWMFRAGELRQYAPAHPHENSDEFWDSGPADR